MEFLTKEEFINVWENETKQKFETHADELTTQFTPNIEKQQLQNQGIDDQGSSVDSVEHQFNNIHHQCRQELNQEFFLKLDHFCRHLIDQQEQFWQKMNLKCDKLLQELSSRFDILSNYVNNIADSQANSMKLFFMHEMELLKQDFKRLVVEQNVRSETSLVSSEAASHLVPYQSVTSFSEPDNSVINQINNENKPHKNQNKSKSKKLKKIQQDLQLHQCDQSEPSIDFALCDKNDSIAKSEHNNHQIMLEDHKLLPEIMQTMPVKTYASVASLSIHAEKSPTNYASVFDRMSDSFQSAPNFCASSNVNMKEESVAATGLFASLIANQMKHKQSSQASTIKSSIKSESSAAVKIIPSKKAAKPGISNSLSDISLKHHNFTITNCSQLSVSNQPFLSPFIITKGKASKARISVRFEKSGQLTVQVLVSKGIQDDSHKWPLLLNGSGYIFNPGSKRVTPLWCLESATCQKPSSSKDDIIFPAEICLMTTKRNYNNITYKELVERYKTGEDSLTFTWKLQATEMQNVSETKQ